MEKALATTSVEADFLFAYATAANYFPIRESENGSWFIQILCEIIEKHMFTKDLLFILTRVNNRVSEKSDWDEKNEQVVKMMSTLSHTTEKGLLLYAANRCNFSFSNCVNLLKN